MHCLGVGLVEFARDGPESVARVERCIRCLGFINECWCCTINDEKLESCTRNPSVIGGSLVFVF